MNRTLLLLFAILGLPVSAQDWTTIPVGTTGTLRAITGESILWIAGDGGFFAESDGLHTTYTPVNVGTTADLHDIQFSSSTARFLSGEAGTFRASQDGTNWFSRPIPDASQTYMMFSRNSGETFASGTGGSIWKTINSGFDWTLQSSGVTTALHDGVGFTSSEAYVVGDQGVLLKTVNGGANWAQVPTGTTADLYDFLRDSAPFIAVGENGTILRSTDGVTWTRMQSGTTRTLRAVAAGFFVVAVGDDGVVLKSPDNGLTWCQFDPGATNDLHAVYTAGLTEIVVLGEGGLMRRTTTGGGACLPAVDATLTRIGAGNIPASGGPLQFRVTLTNTTDEPQTFDAWIDAVIPNGSVFGPVLGPQTVTLNPGQTVGPISFTQNVPAQAPAGGYTVRLRVGAYPEALLHDESTFTFAKNSAGLRGAAPAAGAAVMTPADWDGDGTSFLSGSTAQTGAEAAPEAPLLVASPNPSGGRATVTFALPEASAVQLAVYDVLGREVARLVDGVREAGAHAVAFEAGALPSGVYVARLEAGRQVLTQRLTLVR